MQFSWFDLNWCWIGLAVAFVMLVFLFATNALRNDLSLSRWRDPVWLAWLASAAYAFHQAEEYGVDALGRHFAFPLEMCTSFGQPPYPACNVPVDVFVAINLPVIWAAGLVCALLSRRHTLVGLALYGVFSTNALSHIGKFVMTGAYNPGVATAFLIQLPLSLWVAYAMSAHPRVRKLGLSVIFFAGVVFSGVLLGSITAFTKGVISGSTLVAIQYVNPLSLILIPWFTRPGLLGAQSDDHGHPVR